MIREQVSHFLVLRKLGQGGMGEVYLADDTSLDRKVALKFLPEGAHKDERLRERFLQEARAAAAIDHPYVCKIYEAGVANGKAFIAMEFVEGETLRDLMREGPPRREEALRLGLEIVEALAKAHEKGVVHRDLKPSNIMVTPDRHVKVVDFGLAKRIVVLDGQTISNTGADLALTRTGAVIGTFTHISPEQLCGREVDARTDLFSLGLIFYELLTGVHPFQRPSPMETAMAILHDTAPPLRERSSECPFQLEQIVAKMISKEVQARYQSAREIIRDLRDLNSASSSGFAEVRRVTASIAVLPFVNRSADTEYEYFSDGMTEELIVRLSKIGDLRVISLGSVMHFKRSDKTPGQIGRELGVETILEGSVRHAGDRVRISSTLAEVGTTTQLWAETYDGDAKDVFAIQSEVSEQIALALQTRFPSLRQKQPARPREPANLEAYHLCLKGYHSMTAGTPEGIQQSIRYFRKALDLDPTYARSYSGMATCYAWAGHSSFIPPKTAFSLSNASAKKALEFDPELAEAHASMALVSLFYDWNWERAEQGFRRAIALNANLAEAHVMYSKLLTREFRFDEAIREAQQGLDLDPLSPSVSTNLAWALCFAGRYDDAIEQIHRTLQLNPDYLPARPLLAQVYLLKERYAEAIAILERWTSATAHLGAAYALGGNYEAAHKVLKEITHPGQSVHRSSFDIGLLCLYLDDSDDGFRWLEKACDERDNKLIFLGNAVHLTPQLRKFQADPRYLEILSRIRPREIQNSTDFGRELPGTAASGGLQ
jgi:serine/threonine protein kinase/Tfp pilus assembly protein PilF